MSPNQNTPEITSNDTSFYQILDSSDTLTIPVTDKVSPYIASPIYSKELVEGLLRKFLNKKVSQKNKVASRRAKNKMARTARKKNRK